MTIPTEDCYEWLFRTETDDDNLDMLLDLREGVEDLNQTTGSYRLKDVTSFHPTLYESEFIWIVGSWKMPERISTERITRYVNPNYVHKRNYADIVVKCGCGATMGRERDRGSWDGEHNHTDECKLAWREEARARLVERRKEWIQKAARLYLSQKETVPRMGVHWNNVTLMCRRYGIDWKSRRMEGRERAIWTWRKLHDEYGHTYNEIAEAFGENTPTVRMYASGSGRNNNV